MNGTNMVEERGEKFALVGFYIRMEWVGKETRPSQGQTWARRVSWVQLSDRTHTASVQVTVAAGGGFVGAPV